MMPIVYIHYQYLTMIRLSKSITIRSLVSVSVLERMLNNRIVLFEVC